MADPVRPKYRYEEGIQSAYGQGKQFHTPVFICTTAQRQTRGISLRMAMFNLVFKRWGYEKFVNIQVLRAPPSAVLAFQRERRVKAEFMSNRPIYIVADDDMLLCDNPGVIQEALRIMASHPEFGILSFWPTNANIGRWYPPDYSVYEDGEVMEVESVGGIRVIRKGVVKEFPPMQEGVAGYDAIHCKAVREAGYRVGYFKITALHLGEGRGYSTVWNPDHLR